MFFFVYEEVVIGSIIDMYICFVETRYLSPFIFIRILLKTTPPENALSLLQNYTFFLLRQKGLCVSRINVTNALSSLRSHCEQTSAQKQVFFPHFYFGTIFYRQNIKLKKPFRPNWTYCLDHLRYIIIAI